MSKANNSNTDEIVTGGSTLDETSILSPLSQLIHDGLYLDRTMALKELYDGTASRYDYIVRPNGFGKKILADTLEALFTHDFDTLKGTEAVKSWQEPYCQVVRLDLKKISNIRKLFYPILDLSGDQDPSVIRDLDPKIEQEQEPQELKSSFQDEDIYSFNADLYTLLFNEITKNTAKEIPQSVNKSGSSVKLEDFSTMLSVCSERSAMGQIKDLLSRCSHNSRVLIVENFDLPLLSSLDNPRLYNYRSRVVLTFMNLIGFYKQVFRHVIFLGSINIDYRKSKEEYPPFMDYLPLSKEFSFSKISSKLLGFTAQDLLSDQYRPWLERILANIKQRPEYQAQFNIHSVEDLVYYMEQKYGNYSFDKVTTLLNPSSVISFLKAADGNFKGYWFAKNVPNLNYIARVCRTSHEDMMVLLGIIFAGKLQLMPENCVLPVLINDVGLEDLSESSKNSKEDDKTQAKLDSDNDDNLDEALQSTDLRELLLDDDISNDITLMNEDEIELSSKELDDLEHSDFVEDEGKDELSSGEGMAIVLDENGQKAPKAISNEIESIAQLRRENDDEILSQGYPGIPFPILFSAMGYLTSCKVVQDEIISTIVNNESYVGLSQIIFTHYFNGSIYSLVGERINYKDIFPINDAKLKELLEPVINSIRVDAFNNPITPTTIRSLLLIWLQAKNYRSPELAMGLKYPYLWEVIAIRQKEKAELGLEEQDSDYKLLFDAQADKEQDQDNKQDKQVKSYDGHIPSNSLESALFKAQEEKFNQEDNPVSLSHEDSDYAAVIVEDVPKEPEVVSHNIVDPDEDKSYLMDVTEQDVIAAMEHLFDRKVMPSPQGSDLQMSSDQDTEELASSELDLIDTLTDLLEDNEAEGTEEVSDDDKENFIVLESVSGEKLYVPVNKTKPLSKEEQESQKQQVIRNRRLRLASAPTPEGKTKGKRDAVEEDEDVVVGADDTQLTHAARAAAAIEKLRKGPQQSHTQSQDNKSSESKNESSSKGNIKGKANKSKRQSLEAKKLTGLSALLATQEQVDELKQKSLKLDDNALNGFENIAVVPKHMVSARLLSNLQDLSAQDAQLLWQNSEKIDLSNADRTDDREHDEVNRSIIWDWSSYLDLAEQFKIVSDGQDCLQKSEELERICSLAHKEGNASLVEQCEQALNSITNRSLNMPDFAQGKDLNSMMKEQMHYIANNKSNVEASVLLADLLRLIKEQDLLRCMVEIIELLQKMDETNSVNLQSKAELLDYINIETSDDLKMSYTDRAMKIYKISHIMTKDFALQKLARKATVDKDFESAIFINKLLLKIHDDIEDTINSLKIEQSIGNISAEQTLSDDSQLTKSNDVVNNSSDIEEASGQDNSYDDDPYQVSNKPISKILNENEQLLLSLNHAKLMADSAYNAPSLDEHCNLSMFNSKNALVLEFGVAYPNDDAQMVIKSTASKIAKVRNPIAVIIEQPATEKANIHTVSVSMVVRVSNEGCSLIDLKTVRDNQDPAFKEDISGLYNKYFYRNIQNTLLRHVVQSKDMMVKDLEQYSEALQEPKSATKSKSTKSRKRSTNVAVGSKESPKSTEAKTKSSRTTGSKDKVRSPRSKQTKDKLNQVEVKPKRRTSSTKETGKTRATLSKSATTKTKSKTLNKVSKSTNQETVSSQDNKSSTKTPRSSTKRATKQE